MLLINSSIGYKKKSVFLFISADDSFFFLSSFFTYQKANPFPPETRKDSARILLSTRYRMILYQRYISGPTATVLVLVTRSRRKRLGHAGALDDPDRVLL